ncbi:unnamed protein product [Diabrotica balteata]|uniref:Protein kinase domain-containing protein n=1 Tax=Diabrotica balteata TaxID=107213 RepID=A0A9N9X5M7_DIABA|nr:unnamed protein product [Diabrotica balteata]
MCKALKYLHEKLLVHRDVKASNIMLYGTYFKLADFGTMIDLNVQPESTKISRKPKPTTKDDVVTRNLAKIKPSFDVLELGLTFARLMTGVRSQYSDYSEVRELNERNWACNVRKRKLAGGKEYLSKRGENMPAKMLKPPRMCRMICVERLPEYERPKIFNSYWTETNILDVKKQLTSSCVDICRP